MSRSFAASIRHSRTAFSSKMRSSQFPPVRDGAREVQHGQFPCGETVAYCPIGDPMGEATVGGELGVGRAERRVDVGGIAHDGLRECGPETQLFVR